jgi:hypothetical protein
MGHLAVLSGAGEPQERRGDEVASSTPPSPRRARADTANPLAYPSTRPTEVTLVWGEPRRHSHPRRERQTEREREGLQQRRPRPSSHLPGGGVGTRAGEPEAEAFVDTYASAFDPQAAYRQPERRFSDATLQRLSVPPRRSKTPGHAVMLLEGIRYRLKATSRHLHVRVPSPLVFPSPRSHPWGFSEAPPHEPQPLPPSRRAATP